MRRHVQLAAWAMMWLMMMLPVVAAQQLLTVQKFAGIDNVDGFARQGDELTIQLLAQMLGNPTPDVARQRAQVHNADTYTFMDSCTPQAQAMYQCTYKTTDIVSSGTDDYAIKLYDGENKEIASTSKTLSIDFSAPKIITFTLNPNMSTSAVPVTIRYKVEDYGSDPSKATGCAGIKFINITANNTQVALVGAPVGTCVKESTYVYTPTVTGPSNRIRLCAVATDHLQHQSLPVCRDLLIDSQKPAAQNLELRDNQGFLVTHARTGQPINADVFVRIPDVDVNPATVYADLSKLNPGIGKVLRKDQSGEWFIWRNVAITTPATCQVTVEASDFMGNKDTKVLPCTIGIDDTAPEPLAIKTQFVDEDGMHLLGVNGTIIAEFREAGSGLDKANAFLDLRDLGLNAQAKADRCAKKGTDLWECSWYVRPTASSGTYPVKLLPTTRDDLDNQMSGVLNASIRFDKTAPSGLRIVEIVAFRGQQRVRTNATSLGETLEFVVEGLGFKTATADFSDLGDDAEVPAERCEGNLTKTCTFGVTVSQSGPQTVVIPFTFADAAGNTAEITAEEFIILGISNETNPNYWTLSTECSPTLLDRTTLSVFDHPVYCRIEMTSPNAGARPISVQGPLDFYECSGQTEYVSDFAIENNFAGSTEPYIAMTLVATDYTIDNLSISCPVSILTRVGNYIPQNYEQDNVTIKLDFYNLPLGELYSSIDNEVKDVQDRTEGAWETIGKLQKFFAFAEKLCQILNMIINLLTTLTVIMNLLAVLEIAANAWPIVGTMVAQSIRQSEQVLCNPTEYARKVYNFTLLEQLKAFCDYITCQKGLLDALGIDTGIDEFAQSWVTGFGVPNDVAPSVFGAQPGKIVAGKGEVIRDPATYLNIKDSLVFSIFVPPLCIPGIIYNLDKWRQIECRYGLCLLQEVREEGMPISVCKDQRHYMQCRFVVGEIFNLIPFAPLLNYYLNMFQRAISDPAVLVGMGIAYAFDCQATCSSPVGPGQFFAVCAALSIASQLGDSLAWIQNAKGLFDFGSISETWCNQFEDALDEYEGEE